MRPSASIPLSVGILLASVAPAMAAGGESNLFAGSIMQSLAAIIAFVILFVVLRKSAWGPIIKGLQDRENKIRDDLARAEAARDQAAAKTAELDKKLAEAHAEARLVIDQARGDAEKVRAKLVADTEADIAKLRDRARAEIDAAKNQAVQDLYARSADLAVAVAEKLLQRQIDARDTQKLVEQSLSELDKLSSAG